MYIKVVAREYQIKAFFLKSKKIYETFRATGKAATCVGTTEQKLHHWNVLTEALNHWITTSLWWEMFSVSGLRHNFESFHF